jgi:hypothetical protein
VEEGVEPFNTFFLSPENPPLVAMRIRDTYPLLQGNVADYLMHGDDKWLAAIRCPVQPWRGSFCP